jgi:hypothetical protein
MRIHNPGSFVASALGEVALPSPEGRGWTAAGVFTSRSGTGEGLVPGYM